MTQFTTVSALSLMTIALVLLFAVGALLWHRRKASNRNPMGDKGMEANHPVQKGVDRL